MTQNSEPSDAPVKGSIQYDALVKILDGMNAGIADELRGLLPQIEQSYRSQFEQMNAIEQLKSEMQAYKDQLADKEVEEQIRSSLPANVLFPDVVVKLAKGGDLNEFLESPLGKHLTGATIQNSLPTNDAGDSTPSKPSLEELLQGF